MRRAVGLVQVLYDERPHDFIGPRARLAPEAPTLERLIAASPAMSSVLHQAERVAATDSTVLLLGETGTGKEMLAQAIHELSLRRRRPMVKVNCAALPASLIESELFGRERGAYTGALSRQVGRFELADGSSLFLDEVGELPLALQSKLLRVLQFGEFERLGCATTLTADVRLIAATNCDLDRAVRSGAFRQDLYYRLSVFPIVVPPLRDRAEDIPPLVWSILDELGGKMSRRIEAVPGRVLERLQGYSWPGNVRELRNVLERAMILGTGKTLELEHWELPVEEPAADLTLAAVERRHIIAVLERTRWRVRGTGGAALILGLHEATLRSRMKKLGILRPASDVLGCRESWSTTTPGRITPGGGTR